jgi:protein-L-isoaspartate(D-aspartate) O-methyltransferase
MAKTGNEWQGPLAALVDGLRTAGHIRTERIAEAFRAVPRHRFVPNVDLTRAYQDEALPTKWDEAGRPVSSSSQPAIMAIMLGQLEVAPGHRVLELGAGTGYNAALLAHLVGPDGSVVTIDIDDDVAEEARAHLALCAVPNVEVVAADGAFGWPAGAPYDRIIVTAGAWDIPPAWVEQLAPRGRLVVPLSLLGLQRSIAFDVVGDHLESRSVQDCGFMRLRGAFAGPDQLQPLGEPGLFLEADDSVAIDVDALTTALAQPGEDRPTGVVATRRDLIGGLGPWLAVRQPGTARLLALGPTADRDLVPALLRAPGLAGTSVVVRDGALAAMVRGPVPDDAGPDEPFELCVRPFGAGSDSVTDELVDQVRRWDESGRPDTTGMTVAAYPAGDQRVADAPVIVDRPHRRLVIRTRETRR